MGTNRKRDRDGRGRGEVVEEEKRESLARIDGNRPNLTRRV